MKKTEKIYVNGKTLAEAAGVKPPFITQCRKQGLFKGATRKKRNSYLFEYHLEKCLAILADLDPAKKRKGSDGSGTGGYALEREKLIRAQRRRLEFDEKVKRGLYVERDLVFKSQFTATRVLRDSLLNIPAKTAAIIGAKSKKKEAEVYKILREQVNQGLIECIEALKKIQGNDESKSF